jgi:dihydroorotate dehydrogenase electron transfer subunit
VSGVDTFGRRLTSVVRRECLGAYVVLTVADETQPAPGQFYMLTAAERWGGGEDERPFLPRAFSVLRAREGQLDFMLEDVGPGTNRLCELGPGDGIHLLGPLGNGFTAPRQNRRPVLVGGGVGTAPLAILADALGAQALTLLGFRDAHHAEGAALIPNARVATDDGSKGHHGLVTDLLAAEVTANPGTDLLDAEVRPTAEVTPNPGTNPLNAEVRPTGDAGAHVEIYACGPPPMLDAVAKLANHAGIPAQLAMESGMACGFGACFGCVVPTKDGYVRLCVDGPVLEASAL